MKNNNRLYFVIGAIVAAFMVTVSCGNFHSSAEKHDPHSEHDSHGHPGKHDINDEYDPHGHHEEHSTDVHFTHSQAQACHLAVEELRYGGFHPVLRATGRIGLLPGAGITAVAPASGTVSYPDTPILDGTKVKKGDVLFYVSAGNLAEGDQMARAKAEYEAALKQYTRAQSLVEDKIISQQEFEDIKRRYELSSAAYAGKNGAYSEKGTAVLSPIDGYVLDLKVNAGDYVSIGAALALVADYSRLALEVDAPATDYSFLKGVESANFSLTGSERLYCLDKMNGKVISCSKNADGAFIRMLFAFDGDQDMLPGSFAQVYLLGRSIQNCISVPAGAIIEEQGITSVFVQEEEEIFRKQEVTLGQSDGKRVVVLSGLSEGDKVVVRGAYNVKLASLSSAIPGHTHNH